MQLTFYGAAHEVTGSCYMLETKGRRILIDCGMLQGQDVHEHDYESMNPASLDMVLLTHAHIDHSGYLPLLYKKGLKCPILMVDATLHLCSIMLRDSAHIQEFEAEWKNRKGKRRGEEAVEPIYDMNDAQGAISLMEGVQYGHEVNLFDNVKVRFTDAGHLLGSASIEIWVTEDDVTKKIVFSGDIGNFDQPLINDPAYVSEADYVIMESTYGNRLHGEKPNYVKELANILQETLDKGGNVVIPSFAVGRTQEILYFIRQIKEQGLVKNHDHFPVYVDSPLAVEATSIYSKDTVGYMDEEAMELIKAGINPISFADLKFSISSEDSKFINSDEEPKVIISASGMCEAGRIRHHLKHNLWRKECTILFVGYQANGTLGRNLVDGAKKVKIFGEEIDVAANIMVLSGISGHADRNGLLKWINSFETKPERVFVCHGQEEVCDLFAKDLCDMGFKAIAPYAGEAYDLVHFEKVKEAKFIGEDKKSRKKAIKSEIFMRLFNAGQTLLRVIQLNQDGANKDITRFAEEVESLAKKWDREG